MPVTSIPQPFRLFKGKIPLGTLQYYSLRGKMSRESVRQKTEKELFRGVTMEINKQLAKELEVQEWQVDAAVKLIDEGNTIPFISRYRKEATGSLNDEILRKLFERLTYLRNLEEKKQQVLSVIEEQGKLTPELKKQILAAGMTGI